MTPCEISLVQKRFYTRTLCNLICSLVSFLVIAVEHLIALPVNRCWKQDNRCFTSFWEKNACYDWLELA